MSVVTGMEIQLLMDREIDKNKHYVWPGGYSINGKCFDFLGYTGRVCGSDKKHLVLDVYGYDDIYSPAVTKDCFEDGNSTFDEFFIYLGETGYDADINVSEVERITAYFDDNSSIDLSSRFLDSATKLARYLCKDK